MTLEEQVFQALGEVSMCWSEIPKGTFDSVESKRIGDELMQSIKSSNATAITAFVGWLTSRDKVSGPFSSRHEAAEPARLVDEFCRAQGWEIVDLLFNEQIKALKQHYPQPPTQ